MTTFVTPGANEVATQNKNARLFRQPGAARPNNPMLYSGIEDQYLAVTGVSAPIRGGITPTRVSDPRRMGAYRNVGTVEEAPDFPTFTLRTLESHGTIPFSLGDLTCAMNIYRVTGNCARLDDPNGWTSYVEILSDAKVTDVDGGDRTAAWDSDDVIDNSLSMTATGGRYAVGSLSFGETANVPVDRNVIDIVYGPNVNCGDCGPTNDGTRRIYALVQSSGSGSPGITTEIVYTLNGGGTWVDTTITGLGATVDANAIDIVGNNLVVVVSASLGYYYSPLDDLGRPTTWTLVTSGFVSGRAPNDLFVAGASEVYFAADAGRIYKSTDITSGVAIISDATATTQNLLRIHGDGLETLVATGAAGAVIISRNQGLTWAAPSVAPTADRVSAIFVLDSFRYWIGNTLGQVFYTLAKGDAWTQVSIPTSTVIDDIVFATNEVGYISYRNTTPAGRIWSTWNGGANWNVGAPRLLNAPGAGTTYARGNRLAVPGLSAHPTTRANNLAVAALSSSSNDGAIYLAAAAIR
jgi:photosystem II stability/assembly factor-like uncharacterized protein